MTNTNDTEEKRLEFIAKNTERRRELNAESMKQRANFKDDPDADDYQCTYEATQTLNPITGKVYKKEYITVTDKDRMENKMKLEYKLESKREFRLDSRDCFPLNPHADSKETSSNYLDFQRALAIQEVRDGKMSEYEYADFLKTLDTLVAAYNGSPDLTLETIRDAKGYDIALSQVEERKVFDIFFVDRKSMGLGNFKGHKCLENKGLDFNCDINIDSYIPDEIKNHIRDNEKINKIITMDAKDLMKDIYDSKPKKDN